MRPDPLAKWLDFALASPQSTAGLLGGHVERNEPQRRSPLPSAGELDASIEAKHGCPPYRAPK